MKSKHMGPNPQAPDGANLPPQSHIARHRSRLPDGCNSHSDCLFVPSWWCHVAHRYEVLMWIFQSVQWTVEWCQTETASLVLMWASYDRQMTPVTVIILHIIDWRMSLPNQALMFYGSDIPSFLLSMFREVFWAHRWYLTNKIKSNSSYKQICFNYYLGSSWSPVRIFPGKA